MDLLKENGIKVKSLYVKDSRQGAEKRITVDFIPSLQTQLQVEAPYDLIRSVLKSSNEFNEHMDSVFGVLCNKIRAKLKYKPSLIKAVLF